MLYLSIELAMRETRLGSERDRGSGGCSGGRASRSEPGVYNEYLVYGVLPQTRVSRTGMLPEFPKMVCF